MLTSYLLVKVGFLDSNLLRTFGGPNEVRFGWILASFKALEVSYNFPRNSLLQKTHRFFVICKIPLESQNYQKINFFQNWSSCIFWLKTPSKLSQNHQILDFELLSSISMLEFSKFIQIHAFKLHSLHYLPNHLQNTKPSKMSRNFKY